MTLSLISALTAVFTVFGIIGLTFVAIDTLHQILSGMMESYDRA